MRNSHPGFGRHGAAIAPVAPFFILLFFLLLASGCATMFSRKEDAVTIKTEPPGAEVYLGAEPLGTTPLTYTFKRDTFEQKRLTLRKAGYKTREFDLGRTLEPKALFNLGFFLTTAGASSWGTDAATGAMIRYSPDSYFLDLEPENRPSDQAERARRGRTAFVLVNHRRLTSDLARGEGESLSAYYALLGLPERVDAFLIRMREAAPLLLSADDPVDFSEKLEAEGNRPMTHPESFPE